MVKELREKFRRIAKEIEVKELMTTTFPVRDFAEVDCRQLYSNQNLFLLIYFFG